jgi:GT2 family glycosyltransferase
LLHSAVSVVIPTLAADSALLECLASLHAQTYGDFEVIVVDNSGRGATRALGVPAMPRVRVIENTVNVGFGTAINQGWKASATPFIATLNDDAQAEPGWLAAMVQAAEKDSEIGLIACQVRLAEDALDSAGMLISSDGSSKQRGHGRPPADFAREEDVLMPSGSAALYRREMLEDTGGFADEFFLYCEDTDLGLRARRRGWRCRYVPSAVVLHGYSKSAGRASALKALLVERNRLYLIVRNFPARLLLTAPFCSAIRYLWHVIYMLKGQGKAAEFARTGGSGGSLPLMVLKAHWQMLRRLPQLLRERRAIRERSYLNDRQFGRLLASHSISPREVAAL